MKIDKQHLAIMIFKIRLSLGLSMEKFGALLKASKSSVSGWEKGTSIPNHARLLQLSKLGGISLNELISPPFKGIEEIHISVTHQEKYIEHPSIYNDYSMDEVLVIQGQLSIKKRDEVVSKYAYKGIIYPDGLTEIHAPNVEDLYTLNEEALESLGNSLKPELQNQISNISISDVMIFSLPLNTFPTTSTIDYPKYEENPFFKSLSQSIKQELDKKPQLRKVFIPEYYQWICQEKKELEKQQEVINFIKKHRTKLVKKEKIDDQ